MAPARARTAANMDSHIGQQLHRTARASEYQMNVASDATTVLVFSNRPKVREAIINAVGRRPAADVGRLHYVEVGTIDEVLAEVDAGRVDLAILDGEAQPTGGMGLSRQLKNEIVRSEEHTSELQSRQYLVCRRLLERKK